MNIGQKINVFVQLGDLIKSFTSDQKAALAQMVKTKNEWFTSENLELALNGLQQYLTRENLEKWVAAYPALQNESTPQKVGLLMTGNVPAEGFQDLLSVVMSGHIAYVKLNDEDQVLMKELIRVLTDIAPEFKPQIIVANNLKGIDAIIATENDQSFRYLAAYFGRFPHIFRKESHSVAVLEGNESKEALTLLSNDIFQYFGQGRRNVSKLFVPKDYQFDPFFEALFHWGETLLAHSKYCNSYEYHRALFLMKKMNMLDNNFLLLAEYESMVSPAGVMFFEYYNQISEVQQKLSEHADKIQTVVTHNQAFDKQVAFGQSWHSPLSDYPNGMDTMAFLTQL